MENSQLENTSVAKQVPTFFETKKSPCIMCKFVRIFALIALALVIMLSMFMYIGGQV